LKKGEKERSEGRSVNAGKPSKWNQGGGGDGHRGRHEKDKTGAPSKLKKEACEKKKRKRTRQEYDKTPPTISVEGEKK